MILSVAAVTMSAGAAAAGATTSMGPRTPIERHATGRAGSSPRRVVALTLAALALALAVHVPVALQYREDPYVDSPVSDALSYHRWATRLAEEGLSGEPVFHQAPLFPMILAVVYRWASEGAETWAALSVQILLMALAMAAIVPLGHHYLGSARAGFLGSVLALLHGPFVFHSLKLLYLPAALATQAAAWVALGRTRGRDSVLGACLAGLGLGMAALARPEMLLAVPVFAVALPAASPARRAALVAALALGAAVAIGPVTTHNLRQGDRVLIASAGGENLFIGNQRGARGDYSPIHPKAGDIFSERRLATLLAEQEAGRPLKPSEVSSHWRRKAVREILADPSGWLRLEAKKLARVLHPGDPTDGYSFPLERSLYLPGLHALFLPAWPLLFLGSVGVVVALRTRPAAAWPLAALVGVHLLALLAFFVNTRLRLPLLFALAPFGGLALEEGWRRWRQGRRSPLAVVGAVALVLTVAGAALTAWTPRDVLRLGAVLSTQGRHEEALAALEPAISGPEPFGLAVDQAGHIHQKEGRWRLARDHYRRALAAGLPVGRQAQTRTRLAMVLEKLGEVGSARLEHDWAAALPGADAGTHFERGMFQLRRGELDAAVTSLREAVRLDPSWPPPRRALERLRPDE